MINHYLIFFFFIFLSIQLELLSEPFTMWSYDGQAWTCKTNSDEKTRVTFFGDSRIDYPNHALLPPDGTGLNFYLGATGEGWNVQNYAVSGWTSDNILDYLKMCYNNSNFKIHHNVAFHAGGNDFRKYDNFLRANPWHFSTLASKIANNNERIITLLQKKWKRVLLIGHYPARVDSLFSYHNVPVLDSLSAYLRLYVADTATIASIGLWHLEPKIRAIQQRRSAYMSIFHVHTWTYFQDPANLNEPYRANPSLMRSDQIHPNYSGMLLWGQIVGAAIRALGWHTDAFSIDKQCTVGADCETPKPPPTCSPEDTACNSDEAPDSGFQCDNLCLLLLCATTGKCW